MIENKLRDKMQLNSSTIKFFFFQMYFYLLLIPQKIARAFMKRVYRSGHLVVTGHNSIELILGWRSPKKVEIGFSDNCKNVPCNNHHDELCHRIVKQHDRYHLFIEWDVADTRIIHWSLYS